LFYSDGETVLAVLMATTKKRSSTFFEEKSASGWPGWRIFWHRNDLAPLLRWRRHWHNLALIKMQWHSTA